MTDWKIPAVLLALLAILNFRAEAADTTNSAASATAGASDQQPRSYQARGIIKALDADGKSVVIQHEAVPGYMDAMTMTFEDKNPGELSGLRPGDSVAFRLNITAKEGWIDHVTKTGAVQVIEQGSAHPIVQVVRDVPALNIGDELPDYHFTNELGQPIHTAQFHGQALAFTFFFTRCPYPNFCPYVSNGFEETQKKLTALTNAPTNWHLISISFDPEFDSPDTLKTYATMRQYDPARWSFVTGDLTELTTLGDQFGEYFGRDPSGGFNHNLRTVIIDAKGRVQRIIIGNTWTSDELVAELLKAAAAR